MAVFIPLPSDEEIETFERSFLQQTYHFTNRALIREALQGSGPFNPSGNKILALAGDATLRQILIDQGRDRKMSPGRGPLVNYYFSRMLIIITINRRDPERDHQGGL